MQYGNLKMKEAFSKADNVLATAAKCITDVINSRGHIIVDFSDVCTVMKNGGVAILGKAEVEGENRAQLAIEEALNSPLLNDSDIKGAKWILLNINSAEGDHECTMDELETINNYLRMQAGEDSDVIVGMGYDPALDKKIGITLIATGFEHKDPFAKPQAIKTPEVVAVKEVVTLNLNLDEPVAQPIAFNAPVAVAAPEVLMAVPVVELPVADAMTPTMQEPAIVQAAIAERESLVLHFELSTTITAPVEAVAEVPVVEAIKAPVTEAEALLDFQLNDTPTMVNNGGFLTKPSNIYAAETSSAQQVTVQQIAVEPVAVQQVTVAVQMPAPVEVAIEEPMFDMQLVEKSEEAMKQIPAAPVAAAPKQPVNDETFIDDVEDQKRRATERIQKLRNLSFNMNNTSDASGEFDAVPAYIRRNMELFGNTLTSVENFYSKYTVGKDENNQTQISTINTFLDGKKPD